MLLAIPTRNRDIEFVLESYASNLKRYEHETALLLFDDSDPFHAQRNREAVEFVARVYPYVGYVGKNEKERFIDQFNGLRCKDLEIIFGTGYGSNINCIFAYSIGRKLVVVDDDTLPLNVQARIPSRFRLIDALEQRLKVAPDKFIREVDFDHINFLERMTYALGIKPRSLEVRKGYGAEARDSVVQIYGDHTTSAAPVKFSLASICFDRDLAAVTYIDEFLSSNDPTSLTCKTLHKSLTTHLDPAVLLALTFRSTSFGIDNTSNIVPFIPTGLRGEDLTFGIVLDKILPLAGITYSSLYGACSQLHIKSNVRPTLVQTYLEEEINACFLEKLEQFFRSFKAVQSQKSVYDLMHEIGKKLIKYSRTATVSLDDISLYRTSAQVTASMILERLEAGCENQDANRVFSCELIKSFYLRDELGHQKLERDFTTAIQKALMNAGITLSSWGEVVAQVPTVKLPIYFPAMQT